MSTTTLRYGNNPPKVWATFGGLFLSALRQGSASWRGPQVAGVPVGELAAVDVDLVVDQLEVPGEGREFSGDLSAVRFEHFEALPLTPLRWAASAMDNPPSGTSGFRKELPVTGAMALSPPSRTRAGLTYSAL
jgi:hypothetical protein